jgi:hypothetical protein
VLQFPLSSQHHLEPSTETVPLVVADAISVALFGTQTPVSATINIIKPD